MAPNSSQSVASRRPMPMEYHREHGPSPPCGSYATGHTQQATTARPSSVVNAGQLQHGHETNVIYVNGRRHQQYPSPSDYYNGNRSLHSAASWRMLGRSQTRATVVDASYSSLLQPGRGFSQAQADMGRLLPPRFPSQVTYYNVQYVTNVIGKENREAASADTGNERPSSSIAASDKAA